MSYSIFYIMFQIFLLKSEIVRAESLNKVIQINNCLTLLQFLRFAQKCKVRNWYFEYFFQST